MLMSETMAKSVCAEVSNEIVKIVPQLDDYLCPVCFSISYKPVRLTCNHVFCIRCMVQMQKQKAKYCPLCRNDVIMHADSGALTPPLPIVVVKASWSDPTTLATLLILTFISKHRQVAYDFLEDILPKGD